MDVNKIIILYINLLNYQEHEVVVEEDAQDEEEVELHFLHDLLDFLHDLLDFSSHALQSKDSLEEQEHGFEVEHEVDEEQDQPDEVEHE